MPPRRFPRRTIPRRQPYRHELKSQRSRLTVSACLAAAQFRQRQPFLVAWLWVAATFCIRSPSSRFFRSAVGAKHCAMKAAPAVLGILLVVTSLPEGAATVEAADLRISHRYIVRRVWPQDCFLMPDVVVALDALGPYCSSPRGYYHWMTRHWH